MAWRHVLSCWKKRGFGQLRTLSRQRKFRFFYLKSVLIRIGSRERFRSRFTHPFWVHIMNAHSFRILKLTICVSLIASATCYAQRGQRGQRGQNGQQQSQKRGLDVPDHPQAIGEAGIAWYTTWNSGLAEAQRSNRPIFFMSAATTCSGVSGVF